MNAFEKLAVEAVDDDAVLRGDAEDEYRIAADERESIETGTVVITPAVIQVARDYSLSLMAVDAMIRLHAKQTKQPRRVTVSLPAWDGTPTPHMACVEVTAAEDQDTNDRARKSDCRTGMVLTIWGLRPEHAPRGTTAKVLWIITEGQGEHRVTTVRCATKAPQMGAARFQM